MQQLTFVLWILLFALTTAHPVAAQSSFEGLSGREITPIDGDPLSDYRITGCRGVRGTGWYRFPQSGNDVPTIDYMLSDFCMDLESGDVFAKHPISGLAHVVGPKSVEPGSTTTGYEDITESGTVAAHVYLQPLPEPLLCASTKTGTFLFEKMLTTERSDRAGYLIGLTNGLSFSEDSVFPENIGFGLNLVPISTIDNRRFDLGEVNALFGMWAETKSVNGSQVLEIVEGDQTIVGDAAGTLGVEFGENNEFFLSGDFELKSARFAGFKADDFVSLSGKIEYMRGFVAGENGEGTYALGIAHGTFVNGAGEEHDLRFKVGLTACMQRPGTPAGFP